MDINSEVLDKLLDTQFSFEDFSYENLVGLASGIIETKEINQKILGRLANELERKYGGKVMEKFAQSIFESTGYKIAVSTLRSYRWIYKTVGHLEIPNDFPFHAWKVLASMDDAKDWVDKAKIHGWSGREMIREIKLATGQKPIKKVCPNCGAEL